MSQVSNDIEVRQQLDRLDQTQQRILAASFTEHVLALSTDERVARAVKVAADAAGYFVARAAMAALTPETSTSNPAWQAAMSSRMARTSISIDSTDGGGEDEQAAQYRILDDYLNS